MIALTAPPPRKKGGSGTTDVMWANGAAMTALLEGYALPLKDNDAAALTLSIASMDVTWQTVFQHCGGQIPNHNAPANGGALMAIERAAAQPEAACNASLPPFPNVGRLL